MAPRFIWGADEVEAFFNVLRASHADYLRAKELRRMDEFYENIGACIGADGLIVQNFLKKTGRAYRNILLQAETCGESGMPPERKLRGSARVYRLYEEYYQMYYLGSMPSSDINDHADETPAVAIQQKVNRLGGRKRKSCVLMDSQGLPEATKKRLLVQQDPDFDSKEENAYLVVEGDSDYLHEDHGLSMDNSMPPLTDHLTDHYTAEEVTEPVPMPNSRNLLGNHKPSRKEHYSAEANPRGTSRASRQSSEDTSKDDVFGKGTDFQERFLKLMENQNHILSNIVEELNLIRHAVLDANGLQTITYVK